MLYFWTLLRHDNVEAWKPGTCSRKLTVVRNWHAHWLRWLSSSFSAAALFDALLRRLPRSILFPPPAGPPCCCFCFSASSATYLSRVAPMARHLASSKNQIPWISVSLVLNNRNGGLVCLSSSAVRGWTQLLGLEKQWLLVRHDLGMALKANIYESAVLPKTIKNEETVNRRAFSLVDEESSLYSCLGPLLIYETVQCNLKWIWTVKVNRKSLK